MNTTYFFLMGFLLSLLTNQLNFNVHNKRNIPMFFLLLQHYFSYKTINKKYNIERYVYVYVYIIYTLTIYVLVIHFIVVRVITNKKRNYLLSNTLTHEQEQEQCYLKIYNCSLYLCINNNMVHIHHWMLFMLILFIALIVLYITPSCRYFINSRRIIFFIIGVSIQTIIDGLLFEDRFEV